MSFETALFEKIKNGGFLPLQLTLEPLQQILIELMELIKSQNGRIEKMEKERVDSSQLQDLKNLIDKNYNELSQKINDVGKDCKEASSLAKDASDKVNSMLNDFDKLREIVNSHDKTIKEVLSPRADQNTKDIAEIKDMLNNLKDGVDGLSEKSKDHEQKISNHDGSIEDMKKEIENIKNQLENTKPRDNSPAKESASGNGSFVDLEDFEKLSRRLADLGTQVNKIQADIIPRIDDEELRNRIAALERGLQKGDDDGYKPRPPSASSTKSRSLDNEMLSKLRSDVDVHEDRINGLDELRKLSEELKGKLAKLQADIDSRPDRGLIEKLFEKFKESMNNLADSIAGKGKNKDSGKGFATLEDLKRLENLIKQVTLEFDEAAAARKSTKCLSCGMGYKQVSGSIQDAETAAILGAAPINHVVQGSERRPCFVYGSDNELYYSVSPRGRTFAATGNYRKLGASDGSKSLTK